MTGPSITVKLDASAVAGLLVTTSSVQEAAEDADLPELVDQMRSMRLALEGALRGHGWKPTGNGQWELRTGGRRRA